MRHPENVTMRRLLISIAALGVAIVLASVIAHYGAMFLHLPSGGPLPLAVSASPESPAPPRKVFEFRPLDQPHELPDLRFVDGDGRPTSLADFRGRVVLLNLWATWCVPCRREMPSLDRLQASLGGAEFIVLPLSIDRGGLPPVKRFYEELGLTALDVFVDQSGAAMRELATPGIPTTLLVDRQGREIGRYIGAAEWDSQEAIALIRRYLNPRSGADGAQTRSKG